MSSTGPVNWAPYNPDPSLPGMARLWACEAFAHGAEAACYSAQALRARADARGLCARQPRRRRSARRSRCWPRCPPRPGRARPMWRWSSTMRPTGPVRSSLRGAASAISGWCSTSTRPAAAGPVDIVRPDAADLSAYKLVLAPGAYTLSDPLKVALAAHKGTAILGPRTNSKTPDSRSRPLSRLPCRGWMPWSQRVELPPMLPLAQGGALLHWRESWRATPRSSRWPKTARVGLCRATALPCGLAGMTR